MIRLINTALAQNVTLPSTRAQQAGTAVQAEGVVPSCATQFGGPETLDCVLQLFINVSDIVLGVVGAIFLAVLVYGGILYLTSAGDSAKVQKSTKMLFSSVIGLLIVFGAFSGVTYGVNVLRGGDASSQPVGEYVTCGWPEHSIEGKDGQKQVLREANHLNEGQACGPGLLCRQGVCCDTSDIEGACYIPPAN